MKKLTLLSLLICVMLARSGYGQWTRVTGPTGDVMYLTAYGPGILAQTTTGFFHSTDLGLTWTETNSAFADSLLGMFPSDTANYLVNNFLGQLPPLPDTLKSMQTASLDLSSLNSMLTSLLIQYPETYLDSIALSLDTGKTAIKVADLLSRLALYAAGIDTQQILAQFELAQAWISTNGGAEWVSVQKVMSTLEVRSTAYDDQYAFAATNMGVFRAALNDGEWAQVNSGLADTNVYALAVMGNALFAGTPGGVYISTNEGTTWTSVNNGLTKTDVRALAVYGTSIFAGTHGGGVFVSGNKGGIWRAVNTGLTSMNVNALVVSGQNIHAGTTGGGLWMRPISEMLTAIRPPATPTTFLLAQNYPNPFNPSTNISFYLKNSSHVTLDIYNSLGQKVEELVNEDLNAGKHNIVWNADNFASGIYFYKLKTNSKIIYNKMVLLK